MCYTRDICPGEDGPVNLQISRADLTDPRLHAFLTAHLNEMAPTAPPESRHALDLTGLAAPGIRELLRFLRPRPHRMFLAQPPELPRPLANSTV